MLTALNHILANTAHILATPRVQSGGPAPLATPSDRPTSATAADSVEISDQAKAASKSSGFTELSPEQEKQVSELKKTDREVRQHEQAHKAAAGSYGGAISYTYTTGPDGKRYATGGSVPIDTSPVAGDPQATVQKMRQVQQAANAPADPSPQDRRVAAKAAQEMQKAQAEMTRSKDEESTASGQAVDFMA